MIYTAINFLRDGDNIIAEYKTAADEPTNIYYRDKDNRLIFDTKGTSYVQNNHGDTISTLNSSGTKTKTYSYNAYGEVEKETGTLDNPWQYCGEYTDAESGLIYLRNRYYDTTTGSFLTEDPAKDGSNWYAYCAGNPILYKDSSGFVITCDAAHHERIVSLLTEVSGNSLVLDYDDTDGKIIIKKTYDTENHVGQTLVSDLINSSETVNVNIGVDKENKTNTEWPAYENNPMQIFIDPDNITGEGLFTTYTQDANGNTLEEEILPYIVFGHELIHSWRDIRGLDIPSRDEIGLIPQDSPQLWREEELQTMGINYTDKEGNPLVNYDSYVDIISENGLRLENGLNLRISYYGW